MKIAFLSILYRNPREGGGLAAHIATLSHQLARMDHDVTVITAGDADERTEDGVRVVSLGRVDRFAGARQVLTPNYVAARLRYMSAAARFIRREGFDIVEAADGGFEPLFLLKRRDCPLVVKLHGAFRYIYATSALTTVMTRIERAVLRSSDALYASSDAYADTVAREFRIPRARIGVIPYGIDLNKLDGACGSAGAIVPELDGRRAILLSAGASPMRKGAPIFLEAARLFDPDQVAFILLCSDPTFVRRVAVPSNVRILDHLDQPSFYRLLGRADAAVFPSQFESFSIATYEAMLLGRPVVVSRQVPIEGPARVYPALATLDRLDAPSLAEGIERTALGDNPSHRVLSDQIASLREAYAIETVAEQTLAFYREAADSFARSVA